MAAHQQFMARHAAALRGGNRLHPSAASTSIRHSTDGGVSIRDGAFAETKEVIGGYYLIEAPDLDEAWRIAAPNATTSPPAAPASTPNSHPARHAGVDPATQRDIKISPRIPPPAPQRGHRMPNTNWKAGLTSLTYNSVMLHIPAATGHRRAASDFATIDP